MTAQRIITNPNVESNRGFIALEYGPIDYCDKEANNSLDVYALKISDSLELIPEYKPNFLGGVYVIKVDCDKPILLIPYYTWSNRGVGKMKV